MLRRTGIVNDITSWCGNYNNLNIVLRISRYREAVAKRYELVEIFNKVPVSAKQLGYVLEYLESIVSGDGQSSPSRIIKVIQWLTSDI